MRKRLYFVAKIIITVMFNLFGTVNSNAQGNVVCEHFGDETIRLFTWCNHHSGIDCLGCLSSDAKIGMNPVHRSVFARIYFKENCDYDVNGNDFWNKLLKINWWPNQCWHSVRMGWKWNLDDSKMDLGLYAHIVGNAEYMPVFDKQYPLESWFETELIFGHHGFAVTVGDDYGGGYKGVAIRREILEGYEITGVCKNAYFGGDWAIPHQMAIKVHDFQACAGRIFELWNKAEVKGFGRSIFYSGENKTVYASKRIEASLKVGIRCDIWESELAFCHTDVCDETQFTIIEPGSNVTFVAGEQIILKPGFHAEAGSKFHAYIGSAPQNYIFQPPGTPPNHTYDIFDDGEIDSLVVFNDTLTNNSNSTANEEQQQIKTVFENNLTEPYPNPFTESALIQYSLNPEHSGPVHLSVYNVFGQQVATLVNLPNQEAGVYQVTFHAGNLPSGIYFYTLRAGNFTETKKMVLMK